MTAAGVWVGVGVGVEAGVTGVTGVAAFGAASVGPGLLGAAEVGVLVGAETVTVVAEAELGAMLAGVLVAALAAVLVVVSAVPDALLVESRFTVPDAVAAPPEFATELVPDALAEPEAPSLTHPASETARVEESVTPIRKDAEERFMMRPGAKTVVYDALCTRVTAFGLRVG